MEKIDKNNCHAWMFDHIEGNLDNNEVSMLLTFMDENPSLWKDFEAMKSTILPSEKHVFKHKYNLLKSTDLSINIPEVDYLIIKEMEEGLSERESVRFSKFKRLYPRFRHDYEAYKNTVLCPEDVVFPQKETLLRKSSRNYIWMSFMSVAAAAAIVLFVLRTVVTTDVPIGSEVATGTGTEVASVIIVGDNSPQALVEQSVINDVDERDKVVVKNTKVVGVKNVVIEPTIGQNNSLPIEDEVVKPISQPQIQLLRPSENINVYEKGLSLLMPRYIENNHIIQALKTQPEESVEHRKEVSPNTREKQTYRITLRNITFEWS
jgi:hypothetical protein